MITGNFRYLVIVQRYYVEMYATCKEYLLVYYGKYWLTYIFKCALRSEPKKLFLSKIYGSIIGLLYNDLGNDLYFQYFCVVVLCLPG